MSSIVKVRVKDGIIADDRRGGDPETVSKLGESISMIGLKTPISVRTIKRVADPAEGTDAIADHVLVAGAHRLEAARCHGWSEIDCFVLEGDEIDARLWEIAENLHRRELNVLRRSQLIKDWVEIANERAGQVVHKPNGGGPERGEAPAARQDPRGRTDAGGGQEEHGALNKD